MADTFNHISQTDCFHNTRFIIPFEQSFFSLLIILLVFSSLFSLHSGVQRTSHCTSIFITFEMADEGDPNPLAVLSSPHWVISDSDHGGYVIIASWTMMSYMVLTVIVRLARKITIRSWSLDDNIIAAASVRDPSIYSLELCEPSMLTEYRPSDSFNVAFYTRQSLLVSDDARRASLIPS